MVGKNNILLLVLIVCGLGNVLRSADFLQESIANMKRLGGDVVRAKIYKIYYPFSMKSEAKCITTLNAYREAERALLYHRWYPQISNTVIDHQISILEQALYNELRFKQRCEAGCLAAPWDPHFLDALQYEVDTLLDKCTYNRNGVFVRA